VTTSDDDLIVTVQHLYSVPNFNGGTGFCGRGSRAWFRRHGLDWSSFVRNGISARELVATGDALALRLVEHARRVTSEQG